MACAIRIRIAKDAIILNIADAPVTANETLPLIRDWQLGSIAPGDVYLYHGIPYKCVQVHDDAGVRSPGSTRNQEHD